MSERRAHQALQSKGTSLSTELDDLRTAITLDLCSEIEETRARISGVSSAISGLTLPAYIGAVSLAIIAFKLFAR